MDKNKEEEQDKIKNEIEPPPLDEILKRAGSRRHGKKRNKDKPYPKRKGSFRRFERQDSVPDN